MSDKDIHLLLSISFFMIKSYIVKESFPVSSQIVLTLIVEANVEAYPNNAAPIAT